MIWAVIGVTTWTLPQIMAMTFPQLEYVMRGQGPILYPRLRPILDQAFATILDEPDSKTKESPIDKILREDRERRGKLERGEEIKPTDKQLKRSQAFKVLYGYYLGDPEPEKAPAKSAQPIPGLLQHTAAAIVAFAEAGGFESEVWARDVAMLWPGVAASAALR